MPRAPKAIKRPVGNPQKAIDWDVVDDYLISGLLGSKIADALGIHPDTLYQRCEIEKGTNWSAYLQQKRMKGDGLLHKAQFSKALEGDTSLLIFLGKVRLEQREVAPVTATPEQEKNYRMVIDQLAELQRDRQNNPPEMKIQEIANGTDQV
jgi:hypothetical protein